MRLSFRGSLLLILAALSLAPVPGSGQTLTGPGENCTDVMAGFAGVQHPRRIYFDTAIPAADRGCWVHTHPDGRDRVLTPTDWTATPSGVDRQTVEAAFEAITRSRAALAVLGGTMDLSFDVMLTTSGTGMTTEWPNSDECWIEASKTNGWQSTDAASAEGVKQTFAHEIGHCYLMENIADYDPASNLARGTHWWDESGAEVLSTLVYPAADAEHRHAQAYDLDGARFSQPYNAFFIFDHLIRSRGPDSFLPFMRQLHGTTTDTAGQWRLMGSAPFHEVFHEAVTLHYDGRLEDPGCAGGGACFYPSEETVGFDAEETLADDTASPLRLGGIEGGRLNVVRLTLPEGRDFFISPPRSPSAALISSVVRDEEDGLFARDLVMETGCDAEGVLFVAITHFNPAEAAGAAAPADIDLAFTTTPREECDDGTDPAPGPVTFGYGGRWYATNANILGMYKRLYGASGPEVQAVDGDIYLDLGDDGASKVTWDDVTLFFPDGSGIPPVTIRGQGNFRWRSGGGTLLHLDGQTFEVEAEVLGMRMPAPDLFATTGADTSVNIGLTETGALVFTPTSTDVFFPTFWVRRD